MSMDPPIISMYFDFYGVFDPAEITGRLGIEPTSQFKSGEKRPSGVGSRRRDAWIIEVGPVQGFEIDDLLRQLEAAVSVPSEEVRRVSSELKVKAVVTCEVKSVSSMPSLCFSDEFIRWAASLGAAIDVDIMLLEKSGE